MAKRKNDEAPSATPATPATREGDVQLPKLEGLLGGELDIFGLIGAGFGASPRAKELILKGLLFEDIEQLKLVRDKLARGRGRPRKDFPNIDVMRAAAVLGAFDLWRDSTGRDCPTQRDAIDLAKQIDAILCERDPERKPIFGNTTVFKTFQDSVSKGLIELKRMKGGS